MDRFRYKTIKIYSQKHINETPVLLPEFLFHFKVLPEFQIKQGITEVFCCIKRLSYESSIRL
jgi:hypothetical protein